MNTRFRHLERQRPERDAPSSASTHFGSLEEDAVGEVAEAPVGTTAERGAVLAPPGPAEAIAQLPDREGGAAGTVPAWRGEAFPEDVAAEIRRKLGIPDPPPQPAEPQGPFDRSTVEKLLLAVGVYFAARRAVAMLLTLVLFLALLATGFLVKGCSAITAGGY